MKTFLSILIILSLSGSAFSQEQVLTDNLQSVVENSEIVATDVNSSIQEAVEEIIETKQNVARKKDCTLTEMLRRTY